MKILGIILIILGISGAVTMTVVTYSFTRSYEKLEESKAEIEKLTKQPYSKENMDEIERLKEINVTFQSIVDRSNRNIYLSIGGGLVLSLIGVVLIVKARRQKV